MSVSYKRVQYYSLGKPYYDNKVIAPYPNCFNISNFNLQPAAEQRYFLTGSRALEDRVPYTPTYDVRCNYPNNLTYISEDRKYIVLYGVSIFGTINDTYAIFRKVDYSTIDFTCDTTIDIGDYYLAAFEVAPTYVFTTTSGGYRYPAEGTHQIGASYYLTITYGSCG